MPFTDPESKVKPEHIQLETAEFEELIRENEMMLAEITLLRSRARALEDKTRSQDETIAQLQELCEAKSSIVDRQDEVEELQQKINELTDLCDSLRDDNQALREMVEEECEKNRSQAASTPPPESANALARLERVLRELKSFHSSQQMPIGHLRRCGIAPAVTKDKIKSEYDKNSSTLQKILESSRRLTQHQSDDDEIIVLAKSLVGEFGMAACGALSETLQTVADAHGIPIFVGGATASQGRPSESADSDSKKSSLNIGFWQRK